MGSPVTHAFNAASTYITSITLISIVNCLLADYLKSRFTRLREWTVLYTAVRHTYIFLTISAARALLVLKWNVYKAIVLLRLLLARLLNAIH